MGIFFLIGCVLLVAAFVAAALETMAFMQSGTGSLVISAYDLWYTYWPGHLVVAQIKVEQALHPLVWDPLIVTVLQLPAWALLGVPGMAFLWYFRPRRPGDPQERLEEETLYLYDALAEQAQAEGYDPDDDDMAPDHGLDDELDGEGVTITKSADDYLDDPEAR